MRIDVAEAVWREERASVVASLARRLGDLGLAEDATQEAFAAAAARWPLDGVPDRPGAWLMTTAWRRALDVLRRERVLPRDDRRWGPGVEAELAGRSDQLLDDASDLEHEDDVLTLMLACCHPALSLESRVALTLRHVAGLTSRQIAGAFLLGEATMTKRLVRARAKIKQSGIRFAVPSRDALADRLAAVHAVVYLVFSEGYHASDEGPPVRAELCAEALWLGRQLHRLLPDDHETIGLLALMLLHHSRTAARDDAGHVVPYGDQDRARWDGAAVDEARGLLARTGARVGPYQVEAAIALLHAVADAAESVDWPRIADLYRVLARIAPSPVVEVNRAVAVGRADGHAPGSRCSRRCWTAAIWTATRRCTPRMPTSSSATAPTTTLAAHGPARPRPPGTVRSERTCCAAPATSGDVPAAGSSGRAGAER